MLTRSTLFSLPGDYARYALFVNQLNATYTPLKGVDGNSGHTFLPYVSVMVILCVDAQGKTNTSKLLTRIWLTGAIRVQHLHLHW